MSAIKFRMTRKGTFRANWVDRQNVCGVEPTTRPTYTYTCLLETTDRLDKQGFMMDNMLVPKYFKERYSDYPVAPLSCERIAKYAVNMLLSMLKKNGQIPLHVAVTIGGSAEAELTCTWDKDQATTEDTLTMEQVLGQAKEVAFPSYTNHLEYPTMFGIKTQAPAKQYIVEVLDPTGWRRSSNPGANGLFSTWSEANKVAKKEQELSPAVLKYRAIRFIP